MAYKRLNQEHVPISFHLAARRWVMRTSEDLRISTPRVVWWSGGRRGLFGWCDVDEIGQLKNNNLNLNLDALPDLDHVEFIVCHENRHRWQIIYVRYFGDEAKMEDDANQYAYQMTHHSIKILQGWQAVRMNHIWEVEYVQ